MFNIDFNDFFQGNGYSKCGKRILIGYKRKNLDLGHFFSAKLRNSKSDLFLPINSLIV